MKYFPQQKTDLSLSLWPLLPSFSLYPDAVATPLYTSLDWGPVTAIQTHFRGHRQTVSNINAPTVPKSRKLMVKKGDLLPLFAKMEIIQNFTKQEMFQKHICPPWCKIQVNLLCRSKTCPKQVSKGLKYIKQTTHWAQKSGLTLTIEHVTWK